MIAGEAPKSNTTGEANVLQNQESHSLHEYRKGRLSIFLAEIYRDWVLPRVKKAVLGGTEFLADLSSEEMSGLVDQVVAHEFNKSVIEKVLSGQIVYPEDAQAMLQSYRQQFFKSGNKKLITILDGELDELPIEVEINITSKQRNMALMAQKVAAVFTQESYGLSTLTFGMNGTLPNPQQPSATPQLTPAPNGQSPIQGQPQAG